MNNFVSSFMQLVYIVIKVTAVTHPYRWTVKKANQKSIH